LSVVRIIFEITDTSVLPYISGLFALLFARDGGFPCV
jgi:hypothetical protein